METPLPALRQELRLEPGAPRPDGTPGWTIHDPVQHAHFEIDALDMRLLAAWSQDTPASLLRRLEASAPDLPHGPALQSHLMALIGFLREHHLVRAGTAAEAAALAGQALARRPTPLQWLASRHLSLQIPLLRPSAWLERTLPAVAWLGSPAARLAWMLLTLLGLALLSRQWDRFIGTVPELFTPGGLLLSAGVIVVTKVLHELGHAWVATAQGCRVTSMGVTVMLGVPMLHTDTSEAWRLPSRRQRLWIDAAGVLVETALAGLATLAWTVLPDGALRDAAFVLATTTWLLTLAVNLNPLGRFDGYYFLSDALGLPNLQPRAFALAQWWIETRMLGHASAAPEAVSGRRLALLLAFAALTWLYRMALGLAAALLVYHLVFQALGVLLGLAEAWLLMLRPIVRWARAGRERGLWRTRRTRMRLLGGGALLLALLALPLDRHVEAPVLLAPARQAPLHAPEPARLEQIAIRAGRRVVAGELLMRLSVPSMAIDATRARIALQRDEDRLARGVADTLDLGQRQVLEQQIAENRALLQALDARRQALELRAPQDGVIVDLPDSLQPGDWIAPERELGRIVDTARADAQGHVPQDQAWRLRPGAAARFVADDPDRLARTLRLVALADSASEQIDLRALDARHGGRIATRDDRLGRPVPVRAWQRVVLEPQDGAAPALPLRGVAWIEAEPVSLAGEIARRLQRLLLDELAR
ncbi:HlyD family efflux transporter periplasmic adaptor subunit [Sphaerotilus uruguayifluvii]|uniref:Peptide zinc metalloprotease protein n=1 Tax=Sphaerotilus uruguayifluvii TaxID=2735897 RepID=A0ABX2G8N9_9BURK|nr:HlyD family efflux transporter periplasmic adaptor subunit [Leptothrix sp. C29]NRT58101.1 putative peptide zinc metalloprotease protein [Leptothrix sp. C29]